MDLNLEPWEVECPECKRKGRFDVQDHEQENLSWPVICKKCKGAGKLDWVEAVVGRRTTPIKITRTKIKPRHRKLKKGYTINVFGDWDNKNEEH